jgi:thiamine biosynthesis lipoprotein
MQLVGVAAQEAAPAFTAMQAEITRLEKVFSLYRADSEICRLNRDGRLRVPSPDLLTVLAHCDVLHAATNGAFDPTVQPIFLQSANAAKHARGLSDQERTSALSLVDWESVHVTPDEVRLKRPGATLTLNGIAQGYITDRIAAFLQAHGFADILVDMGEVVASGLRSDGADWQAGIASPEGTLLKRLTLSDRALATSAPKGTVLDPDGLIGHIFDPATGKEAIGCSVVSVSGPTAVLADGLSTALCVLPAKLHQEILAQLAGYRIEIVT